MVRHEGKIALASFDNEERVPRLLVCESAVAITSAATKIRDRRRVHIGRHAARRFRSTILPQLKQKIQAAAVWRS